MQLVRSTCSNLCARSNWSVPGVLPLAPDTEPRKPIVRCKS
jgi:hypothetical protein